MARETIQKKATGDADFEIIANGSLGFVLAQNADGTHDYKDIRTIEPKIGALDIITERTGDDQGWTISGELSVGTWDDPRELVVGGGDSTTETMICLHTDDDVNFTDISNILSSDSGSDIGLFGGTTAGKTIYVGGDFFFSGAKVKINTAGDINPENVIAEYWTGSAWQAIDFMATDANYPYTQYGWYLATVSGSQQWRFDFNPYGIYNMWQQSDINGSVKYWTRFRIETAIATDPIVEQLKLHTSRWECNADGFTEYFGVARYKSTILAGVNNFVNNSARSPSNENVLYAPNVTAGYLDNEFANGTIDSKLFALDIPQGLDTSVPLQVQISGYVKGTSTGDMLFQLGKIAVSDDFVYDGSGTMTYVDKIVSTPTSNDDTRITFDMLMRVNEAGTNLAYLFEIRRLGGDALDTLSNNFVATHIKVNGYFWKP